MKYDGICKLGILATRCAIWHLCNFIYQNRRRHLEFFYSLCLEELEIVVNSSLHVHQLVAVLEGGY